MMQGLLKLEVFLSQNSVKSTIYSNRYTKQKPIEIAPKLPVNN
jgi:hypothetical protein